jgi:hypothetical protein
MPHATTSGPHLHPRQEGSEALHRELIIDELLRVASGIEGVPMHIWLRLKQLRKWVISATGL